MVGSRVSCFRGLRLCTVKKNGNEYANTTGLCRSFNPRLVSSVMLDLFIDTASSEIVSGNHLQAEDSVRDCGPGLSVFGQSKAQLRSDNNNLVLRIRRCCYESEFHLLIFYVGFFAKNS